MHAAVRPRPALAALLAGLALWLAPATAPAQDANFKPLERGDYTEVEQRLLIARGLEVSADYALRVRSNHHPDLLRDEQGTGTAQDLRLNLDTVFHTDVRVHLTLELGQQSYGATQLRESTEDTRGRLGDGLPLGLSAREAYLRYNFNPRSGIVMGKQELSLGDRRGKIFDALVPGITFDCQAGTWCMPFGYANIGPYNSDAVIHWALQYNAWDAEQAGVHDLLKVEVFRIHYAEQNVPLGRNLGPARFNPDDPTGTGIPASPDPSQLLETGAALPTPSQPIYYDASQQNYYGFRLNWLGGPLFANVDATLYRGWRKYHLYTDPSSGVAGPLELSGALVTPQAVRGSAVEAEFGWRWAQGRVGLRMLNATGDSYEAYSNGQNYARPLAGYYEITPGSYAGTRLWFNGVNSAVEQGGGLGHSVNNTRMTGVFVDFADREKLRFGYASGVYRLAYNKPIPTATGAMEQAIGTEWDNVLSWYVHKALKFQLEANGILAGAAFRLDDQSPPPAKQNNIYQVIGRVVYGF